MLKKRRKLAGITGAVLGAVAGYLYWYFYGCNEGCTITSVWWRTTIWGALTGYLLLSAFSDLPRQREAKNADQDFE